jgi:FkbM family methyltransferase|tara:strand:+ start:19 stop:741 length:723 start_codon:yes stop_codon:yes gene_type:complete
MGLKNTVRLSLNFLHLDLTKNLEYDRLTKAIMKSVIKVDSNCIDIGCHKGEILDDIIKHSPKGIHFGFEPIPILYNQLKKKYENKATILPDALSDKVGNSTFQFVKNAPAYSGIKRRDYDVDNPEIEEITVTLNTLDKVLPKDLNIDFIKIDVEGGEFGVLKGGKELLLKNKPIIVFECGLGASNYYNTKPTDVFNYLTNEIGLKISLLKSYLNKKSSLSLNEFKDIYNAKKEYYFIAHL